MCLRYSIAYFSTSETLKRLFLFNSHTMINSPCSCPILNSKLRPRYVFKLAGDFKNYRLLKKLLWVLQTYNSDFAAILDQSIHNIHNVFKIRFYFHDTFFYIGLSSFNCFPVFLWLCSSSKGRGARWPLPPSTSISLPFFFWPTPAFCGTGGITVPQKEFVS